MNTRFAGLENGTIKLGTPLVRLVGRIRPDEVHFPNLRGDMQPHRFDLGHEVLPSGTLKRGRNMKGTMLSKRIEKPEMIQTNPILTAALYAKVPAKTAWQNPIADI